MGVVTAKDQISAEALERWEDALSQPAGNVRLEFGFAFGAKGSYPTISVHVKEGGRWKKVSPFLVPGPGEGRAELLQAVASMVPEGL